jgi:hypothetical protein
MFVGHDDLHILMFDLARPGCSGSDGAAVARLDMASRASCMVVGSTTSLATATVRCGQVHCAQSEVAVLSR